MIESSEKRFWNEARLIRLALAVLAAVAIAAIAVARGSSAERSMIARGDFPGFLAPAVMIVEGQGERLYDRALQQSYEERLWPSMRGEVLVSVYPAFVPVVLMPLAYLPIPLAKAVFAFIALAGIHLFAVAGFPSSARRSRSSFVWSLLMVLFPPLAISVLGGQNTGITLGLIGVLMCGLRSTDRKIEPLLGIVLALLLYKPQFGVLLLLPFLIWRRWRVLLWASVGTAVLVALPIPWTGAGWISAWVDALSAFAPENFRVNAPRMISPMALVSSLFGVSWFSMITGILATGGLYFWALWAAATAPLDQRSGAFGMFAMTTAFLSPQALFYDLGILAPLVVLSTLETGDERVWRYLGWCCAAGAAFFLLDEVPVPVFFFLGGALLVEKLAEFDLRRRLSL